MSNKNHHHCPYQKGTFVEKDLLLSKAFLSMSKHGRMILLLLMLKVEKRRSKGKNRGKFHPVNNGFIELSYKELYSIDLKNQQIARGFDDVFSRGFVKMTERGGKGKGSYNLYELIEDWTDYGTPKFKDRERPKSVGYGYCSKNRIDSHNVTRN